VVKDPLALEESMVAERVLQSITGAVLLTVLAVSPASGLSRRPPEPDRPPGKVIVKFREGVTAERSARIVEEEGGTVDRVMNSTGVHLVVLTEGMDVAEAVKRLSSYPEVLYAEPVWRKIPLEEK
jgi:hypothetical protein